jgi:hypothetical protein
MSCTPREFLNAGHHYWEDTELWRSGRVQHFPRLGAKQIESTHGNPISRRLEGRATTGGEFTHE